MVSSFTLNVIQSYERKHPWDLSYPGLINFGTFNVSINLIKNYSLLRVFYKFILSKIFIFYHKLFDKFIYDTFFSFILDPNLKVLGLLFLAFSPENIDTHISSLQLKYRIILWNLLKFYKTFQYINCDICID